MYQLRLPKLAAQIANWTGLATSIERFWTIAGSWVVHHGRNCVPGQDQLRTRRTQVNTSSGRPLCSLNRAPLTRPTDVHTLEHDVQTSCADAPQDQSLHVLFRTVVLERLRLPLMVTQAQNQVGGVCREAAKLREMNIAVSASDERSIEVLASGLPAYQDSPDIPRRGAAQCSQCQQSCARWSPSGQSHQMLGTPRRQQMPHCGGH